MAYDKKSFLTGLSVGSQLKGWASVGGSGGNANELLDMLSLKPITLKAASLIEVDNVVVAVGSPVVLVAASIILVTSFSEVS